MITLDKKLVDDVIEANRNYYKGGGLEALPAVSEKEKKLLDSINHDDKYHVRDLIGHLSAFAKYTNATNEQIYKALKVFNIVLIKGD